MATKYYIHQSVEILYFEEHCQLKLLYDAFTIENGREVISSLVEYIRISDREKSDIVDFIKNKIGVEQSSLDLVDFLLSKDVLVSSESKENIKTDYDGYIDILGRTASLYRDFDFNLEIARNVEHVYISDDSKYYELLSEKISKKGMRLVSNDADAEMLVYIGKSIGYDRLLAKNKVFFESKKPYLLANVERNSLSIGPLTIPGYTSCYQCFYSRKFSNIKNKNEFFALRNFTGDKEVKDDFLVADFVVNRVVNEIVKYRLGDSRISAVEKHIEIDMITTEIVNSQVYKAPRCNVCSCVVAAPPPALRDLI